MPEAPRKRVRTHDGSVSPPSAKRSISSAPTINQQAVSNFFMPASQKQKIPEKLSWRVVNSSLIVGRYNAKPESSNENDIPKELPRRIAAFDFDSTIIKTASGNRFAKDANDWCWWHGSVPGKLKSLHNEGYLLVLMSNQSGISLRADPKAPKNLGQNRFIQFKQKAGAVFNSLNLPLSVYAASENDGYRKPRMGMWDEFLKDQNLKTTDINYQDSLFVGDAGGRPAGQRNGVKARADFSCSDRNFAENIGVTYRTPEEFFLGEEPHVFSRSFLPSTYIETEAPAELSRISKIHPVDIFLFVGTPGSGKSTFYRKILQPLGYERVNQDILKSREKCLKVAEDYIHQGKSVAIDNTNPDPATREHWVNLAKKLKVPIRCALFDVNVELGQHNDAVRALAGQLTLNPEARTILPRLAFTSFSSRYKEPITEEGFEDITRIPFVFDGSDKEREIWSRFWL